MLGLCGVHSVPGVYILCYVVVGATGGVYLIRARISCWPIFGGCVFAIRGGLLSNMLVYSGVFVSVCAGCSMCCKGVWSKSGPSVAEKVGLGVAVSVWCLVSNSSRLNDSVNSGLRKVSG